MRAGRTAYGIGRTLVLLFFVSMVLLLGAAAGASDDDDEQIERELTTQASSVEAGFIYNNVDGNSPFAFGNYTGLYEDDQFYGIGNLDIYRRAPWDSDSSQYYRLRGLNLGLDSRFVGAEYGHQGRFGLRFLYDELPVYETESALTFFTGGGNDNLLLPPGWIAGARADVPGPLQTSINDNLRLIDIDWKRRKIGGGVSLVLPASLEFEADYLYETKKGSKLMAAIIGENGGDPRAAIVPEPLDYRTQQINGALRYGGENLQLGLEYYGSTFDNGNHFLSWEVPFTARTGGGIPIWDLAAGFQGPPEGIIPECVGVPNCGMGRKGQMPDNWFHQIVASGGYNLPYQTRVTLSTAFSWMLQDQNFLAYSVNPNLAVGIPLPRSSLDGEIFTTVVDFGVSSRPVEKVRLDLGYRFEDRDNQTDKDVFVYITSDAADQGPITGGSARVNLPYSLTKHEVHFDAGYQLPLRSELTLGYEWEQTERDYQERDKLWANTLSAIITGRPTSFLQTRINYEHVWRDGDGYDGSRPFIEGHSTEHIAVDVQDCLDDGFTTAECLWENHPLLRKYYLADLHRDKVSGLITLLPHEDLSIATNMSWTLDDYHETDLGLTEFQSLSPGIDISYAPLDCLSTYAFYNYQWTRYEQNGWDFTGGGDRILEATDPNFRWSSKETVHTHTVGVGFDLDVIPRLLSFGADYLYAESRGKINNSGGTELDPVFPFPDTLTRQNNVSVHTEYRFTENFSMRVGYLFEKLTTKDWALDGISPTSIDCSGFANACVIGAGQQSPEYTAHAVSWSLVYKFW